MRKILVVAYHFPPDGVVGAIRVAKFAKYLSRLNWVVKVLTVEDKFRNFKNNSLLKEVEHLDIVKTKRLRRFIPAVYEEGLYWLPILWLHLLKEIKSFKPQVVYFNGGPFYHWVSAYFLKKFYKLPYVLDFRDPWSLNPYRKTKKTLFSQGARILESLLEPLLIKNADLIINVTDEATNMYQERYGNYSKEKFITIPNGFDREDLEAAGEGISFSNFDIVYTGKFDSFRNPKPFFKAFKQFIMNHSLSPEDMKFVWVGHPEELIVNMIESYSLGSYCYLVGYKPYHEALQYIKGGKVGLVIAGEHIYEPTTKIFDYIFLNKFILALAPVGGFIDRVLKDYRNSIIIYNNKKEEILKELVKIYNSSMHVDVNQDFRRDCFDREILTFRLSEHLQSLIKVG